MTLSEAKVELEKFVKQKTTMRPAFLDAILSADLQSEWIPVEEKEPEWPCLICDANGNGPYKPDGLVSVVIKKHGRCFFDVEWWRQAPSPQGNVDFLIYQNRIVAWMPLPKPYKGESENGKKR